MDTTQIIGTIGSGVVLIGFLMIQSKKWSSDGQKYLLSNLIGSLLLIVYAIILKSYPFVVLNTIWVAVSLYKLVELAIKNKKSN
jgi:phosphatidylserine synthase